MRIDVERDDELFAYLDVKLAQAVFAKHAKYAVLRILLVGFDNELLRLPSVTRTLRNTAAGFKRCNDFS